MRPETLLAITAALAGFLLKTSLAFVLCWVLSKILVSPSLRFLVWFSFLACSGCYWLWLGAGFLPHKATLTSLVLTQSPAAAAGKWHVGASWVLPLSYCLFGSGVLYLIVLAYFLLVFIKKQMHLRWVLCFAYAVPDDIERVFRRIADSLHGGGVRVMRLSGIHSPGTFGWIRPVILLPPDYVQQDRNELEIVFCHELQHVKRRDFVFMSVASVSRALLFFHPAMWCAMRNLRLESELACDLAVVGDSPERRATYAECLLRFARFNAARESQPWNLDFAGASSVQLKMRIHAMLKEAKRIPGWLIGVRISLGMLLIAGFLWIAPSLFIVLSYEQHRVAKPTKLMSLAEPMRSRLHIRSYQKIGRSMPQLPTQVMHTSQPGLPAVRTITPVETAVAPVQQRASSALLLNSPGPTLKRRGDELTPTASQTSTTIHLSGESPTYSGGPDAQRRTLDSALTTISDLGGLAHEDKESH